MHHKIPVSYAVLLKSGYSQSPSLLPHNLILVAAADQREFYLLLIQVNPCPRLCLSGIKAGDFFDEAK